MGNSQEKMVFNIHALFAHTHKGIKCHADMNTPQVDDKWYYCFMYNYIKNLV